MSSAWLAARAGRVIESLELVQEGQLVVVRRELNHQPVLDVERHRLAAVAVRLDERVQRVAGRHPRDEPGVGRERDDRVPLDAEVEARAIVGRGEERVDEAEELHDALVLPQVLVPLE